MSAKTNWTTRFRIAAQGLFIVEVLAATIGWLFFALDPAMLAPVVGWVAMAIGVGEAANVGKRATYKSELGESECH